MFCFKTKGFRWSAGNSMKESWLSCRRGKEKSPLWDNVSLSWKEQEGRPINGKSDGTKARPSSLSLTPGSPPWPSNLHSMKADSQPWPSNWHSINLKSANLTSAFQLSNNRSLNTSHKSVSTRAESRFSKRNPAIPLSPSNPKPILSLIYLEVRSKSSPSEFNSTKFKFHNTRRPSHSMKPRSPPYNK